MSDFTGDPGGTTSGIGEIRYAVGRSALGGMLAAWSGRGLCALLLGDDPGALVHDLRRRFPRAVPREDGPGLLDRMGLVVRFLDAPSAGLDMPLDPRGTPFQREVWRALGDIPSGSTESYAEIARRLGRPSAARAVAGACAANPLAVLIPCHRAVRTDGSLSGYRWGAERKRALLDREAARPAR